MYYNKSSMDRLSQFAKASKNFLLYGSSGTEDKPKIIPQAKVAAKPIEKSIENTAPVTVIVTDSQTTISEPELITQADLQQAIIWSEILGKPMCKRRERRTYGN